MAAETLPSEIRGGDQEQAINIISPAQSRPPTPFSGELQESDDDQHEGAEDQQADNQHDDDEQHGDDEQHSDELYGDGEDESAFQTVRALLEQITHTKHWKQTTKIDPNLVHRVLRLGAGAGSGDVELNWWQAWSIRFERSPPARCCRLSIGRGTSHRYPWQQVPAQALQPGSSAALCAQSHLHGLTHCEMFTNQSLP